ncbi:FAD-dependent monooxygenase [Chelativorans sp.]|uniref:FAD-dependent monooxygenase n=1 Tax=Chelativorans sp. TaxID=2203393 RepID=UPI0028117AC7|nr:FAD-dependent monooxygenase [Chelativorans sp.]
MERKDVLISGAGIAGPVLAHWLRRHGYRPTVVEQASELRMGGHPVDLWGSAVEVMDRMGVLPALDAARTRNDRGVTVAPRRAPVELDLRGLSAEFSDRHVEIMRGELVSTLYRRTRTDAEYVFGDSIGQIEEQKDGVRVRFDSGEERDFALVIGADGQHSRVRHLVFGEEELFSRYMGAYVCGYTVANDLGFDQRIFRYVVPERTVAVFPIRQSNELGVAFLFRRPEPLDLHHKDIAGQKRVLRETFARDGWQVPQLLGRLDSARDFYFEPLSQIHMGTWGKGRIALVGDAGYCPAPAVGGGTSLAVIGAYVLARELAAAAGDHALGFRNYEAAIRETVEESRKIGPALLNTLVPASWTEIRLGMFLAPLLTSLPRSLRRWLPLLPRRAVRAMQAISNTPLGSEDSSSRAGAAAAG